MVKTSWYPNWKAEGADGPWRATPNFMVVVPTSKHVKLTFATTTVEWVGPGRSRWSVWSGLGGLVWWGMAARRPDDSGRSRSRKPASAEAWIHGGARVRFPSRSPR